MSDAAPMMSVEDALRSILAATSPVSEVEDVPLRKAGGRTLARDLAARRTQPPVPMSAMDGYALRAADVTTVPARLRLIGESAAGRRFTGTVAAGEAVRIFTGAPMPEGADTVLIQENAAQEHGTLVARQSDPPGRNVRAAGQDFREGEVLLRAGGRLRACDLALAAAMNHPQLPCTRAPRVAILATGDELVEPGTEPGPDQIVASNSFALASIVESAGGSVIDLGIVPDRLDALMDSFETARAGGADLLVTLGGASVGDHDLVQRALVNLGMKLGFWRVAMRPGKPLMHGQLGALQVLGLPGNPVSAIVCGLLFVRPLVRALCGDAAPDTDLSEPAVLGAVLAKNDARQDYMRARLVRSGETLPTAVPGARQDSSLLKALSDADCLIVRAPHAPAAVAGEPCRIIRMQALTA